MQEIRFWSKNGKGEFVAAFLDDHIESPGRLDQTISSILFYKSEVEHFAKDSRAKASGDAVSIREASQKLNCDPIAIKALARDGYLDTLPGPDRLRVTQSSIEQFLSTHISLLAVAREHHSSTRKLHSLCMAQRIKTIRIPHEKSGESVFIALDSAAKLVSALLDSRPAPRVPADKALSSYLASLQETGQLLPRRAGKPNLQAIASACKFERSTFYKNKLVSQILERHQFLEAEKYGIQGNRTPSKVLSDFLLRLNTQGERLPLRGSKPNLKEISKHCGFKRDCFYIDHALREMLDKHLIEDISRI